MNAKKDDEMEIKNLLKGYAYKVIHAMAQQEITGIQYDSRLIQPGHLFVAIKGYQVDGHDYIEKALEKGAVAIICSDLGKVAQLLDQYPEVQWIFVEDSRNALAYISNAFYQQPSKKLPLVGITGTNGKTSITQLMSNMLEALNRKTGVIGTIGNKVGQKSYDTAVTTPESLNLNQLFNEMVSEGVDACLMEVSSHSLSLDRVAYLNYNVSIFTNLTQDHLDFHHDFEDYYSAKRRLFLMTDTFNLINSDDPYGQRIIKDMAALKPKAETVTYGIDSQADIMAKNVQYSMAGVSYDLWYKDMQVHVAIPMPGKIYVYNTLAAIGALILMGATEEDVKTAIQGIQPVPGRFEQVPTTSGINVIVDYAHAPDALENVLSIAKEFTEGQLIVVFGCGGDRDKSKRPLMGQIAQEGADYVVVTSDNPRTEVPEEILADILTAFPEVGPYQVNVDRKEAIEAAIALAKPKDTVVIAGKGHETYQIIGTEKIDFDDRKIAAEFLATKGEL
jgi:UDP-N-acetylmuramoyl-L-alanyl-D-glutamate--2,6-diaminopimelate ligase